MSKVLPIIPLDLPSGVVPPFSERIGTQRDGFRRRALTELQINLGKLCNQTCTHCHVDAGPTKKRENMSTEIADRILELTDRSPTIQTVDLTGGAPEMNPHFRRLAVAFRKSGKRVIDRCNLTILTQPGFDWVAPFLGEHRIDVVASLPCYLEDNVDGQRGDGVFGRSITGLKMLNELGYGREGTGLRLDLVYNPTGPTLPPDQTELTIAYREQLRERFGIEFSSLLTITNIPIRRYATYLKRRGQLADYQRLLSDHFNPASVDRLMCRSMVSVSWDGRLYDCDFNQMIDLVDGAPTIFNIDSLDEFLNRPIAVADHCYGCTAGAGSGCGGALVSSK